MLGNKWENATATIMNVESQPGPAAGLQPVHTYHVEVRKQNGETQLGTFSEKSQLQHQVGHVLNVEVHSKSGEIRRSAASRTESVRGMVNMAQMIRDAGTGGPGGVVGGLAEGVAGLAGMLAGAQPGGPRVFVNGPGGGQFVHMSVQPDEIQNLARAMMTGTPAEKQAARARMQEIKAQAQQQAMNQQSGFGGQQQSGFGGPQQEQQSGFGGQQQSGFGGPQQAMNQQSGFGGPQQAMNQQSGFGGPQQEQQSGFGGQQQSAFGGLQPASPAPGPFYSESSFGSFSTGADQGTREQRMARIQEQFNKGILTESEFEAQRRQILGS
jgi:hypothetical protein